MFPCTLPPSSTPVWVMQELEAISPTVSQLSLGILIVVCTGDMWVLLSVCGSVTLCVCVTVCVYVSVCVSLSVAAKTNCVASQFARYSPFSRDSLSICAVRVCVFVCVCEWVSVCVWVMPFTAGPEQHAKLKVSHKHLNCLRLRLWVILSSSLLSCLLSWLPPSCQPACCVWHTLGVLFWFSHSFFLFCFFACLITRKTSDNMGLATGATVAVVALSSPGVGHKNPNIEKQYTIKYFYRQLPFTFAPFISIIHK